MPTPRSIDSLGGRLALVGVMLAVIILFALWFTSRGPFAGLGPTKRRPVKRVQDPQEPYRPNVNPGTFRYPDLQSTKRSGPPPMRRVAFDPALAGGAGKGAPSSLMALLARLPAANSLSGIVDVDQLRTVPWAAEVLQGKRLPGIRARLLQVGVEPARVARAAFSFDVEQRAPTPVAGRPDLRLLGKYDRPFYLLTAGRADRKALLKRFRERGPLAASMLLGRRVYRRAGDYALCLPAPRAVLWSYRQPMGPLLRQVLARRATLADDKRKALVTAGVLPPAGAKQGMLAAPPVFTMLWQPRPKRRIPWPLRLLRGVALRGMALYFRLGKKRIEAHLRIMTGDERSTTRAVRLLRWLRAYIARDRIVTRALLSPLVRSVTVQAMGNTVRMDVVLRPWHVRAILPILHKLLEG